MRPGERCIVTLLLLLLVGGGCIPSQHDPVRFGTLSIAVDPTLREPFRSWVRAEAASLEAIGPDVTVIDDNGAAVEPCTVHDCTVAVRFVDGGMCSTTIELADPVAHVARMDLACTPTEFLFRHVFAHAVIHAAGIATHACLSGSQPASDQCDPDCVARFTENPIMAPGVATSTGEDLTSVDPSQTVDPQPSDLCLWSKYR